MPSSILRAFVVIPLTVVMMTGCVIAIDADDFDEDGDGWQHRQRENRAAIADLELGLRRSTVEDRLGEPDFVESFMRDGKEYVVLMYRTHRSHEDGRTTRDETTPVVFVDGNVVGWGDSAIEYATADG